MLANKTICLNMIVKNESAVIQRCLESVKSLIDYWVIVDTGSTDQTKQIIQEYLKDIPGELYERPWIDFAANRNDALQLAKTKADYLLFIDADDYLVFSEPDHWPNLEKDCYTVDFIHGSCRSERALICKSSLEWNWEGVIHEVIDYSRASQEHLSHVIYMTTPKGSRSSDMVEKFRKDAEVLAEALKTDPKNSRYVFQLAGCLEAAGDDEKALKYFSERSQMGEWKMEVFISLYRMGIIQQRLSFPADQYIQNFVQAFRICPTRAEPLYCLADHYMNTQQYLLGYLLSKFALSLPPQTDHYFTQFKVYEYGLLSQLAECAFRINQYQESYEALNQLLAKKNLPEDLRKNSEEKIRLFREQKK